LPFDSLKESGAVGIPASDTAEEPEERANDTKSQRPLAVSAFLHDVFPHPSFPVRESRANHVGSIPSCRRQIHVTVSVQTQIDGGAITPAAIIEPRGDDALRRARADADFATPA
jgi:hypothetical protein